MNFFLSRREWVALTLAFLLSLLVVLSWGKRDMDASDDKWEGV